MTGWKDVPPPLAPLVKPKLVPPCAMYRLRLPLAAKKVVIVATTSSAEVFAMPSPQCVSQPG
jgi:hypothetical protein